MGRLAIRFQRILEAYEKRMKKEEYGDALNRFQQSIVPFVRDFDAYQSSDSFQRKAHTQVGTHIAIARKVIESPKTSISDKLAVIDDNLKPALHGLRSLDA